MCHQSSPIDRFKLPVVKIGIANYRFNRVSIERSFLLNSKGSPFQRDILGISATFARIKCACLYKVLCFDFRLRSCGKIGSPLKPVGVRQGKSSSGERVSKTSIVLRQKSGSFRPPSTTQRFNYCLLPTAYCLLCLLHVKSRICLLHVKFLSAYCLLCLLDSHIVELYYNTTA